MKWSRILSKPVGTGIALFGLLNIAGVIVDVFSRHSFDAILPGVAIGGVFAAVGFKRGLPIVPVSAGSGGRADSGLTEIRRRFHLLVIATCAWFPAAVIIFPKVPLNARTTAFFLVTLVPLLTFVWWVLSACPRCREHFFAVGRLRMRPSFSRCQHCGLQMKRGTAESAG